MPENKVSNSRTGFSLLEFMIVIVIIGILVVSGFLKFSEFYKDYRLNFSAKIISDTIFFASNYSNFFKKKTAVKFYYRGKVLMVETYSYKTDTDTKLIQRTMVGDNIVINPLDSGASTNLPIVYFNKNYLVSGKADVQYPSFYVSSQTYGKMGPLISITTDRKPDPTLKENKNKYKTVIIYELTGKTKVIKAGYETNTYFKN